MKANRCDALGILYIPEWGYMGALDAYFYSKHNLTASDLAVPSDETLGPLAYQFVVRDFPPINYQSRMPLLTHAPPTTTG